MPPIRIDTHQVSGIPYLTIAPESDRPLPLVFFNHGFTGNKEDGVEVGYRLAKAGMLCVLMDAYRHGERLEAPMDDLNHPDRRYIYPQGSGFDTYFVMLECALQTSRDIETLINYFDSDPRVDTARTGVTGFSMGGFATYFCAANCPRLSAAAPMGAVVDLPRRWRDLIVEAAVYDEWTTAMDGLAEENERRAHWMADIDPAEKMLRDYRKPLFILHGELDTDSPKAYSIPFYAAMRARYHEQPDQMRMKIYDRTAHNLDNEMIADLTAWFKGCLV